MTEPFYQELIPVPDYESVKVSEIRVFRTADGTPYGPIVEVKCVRKGHCLQLVPVIDGRLGEHRPGDCPWTGAHLVDDRETLAGRDYSSHAGITTFHADGSRTPGVPFEPGT